MLEQCLRELARGPELVSELSQGHRPAVAVGQRDHAAARLREYVTVVMERARDPHGAASGAQHGELVGVELTVQWGSQAGVEEAAFKRYGSRRELDAGRWPARGARASLPIGDFTAFRRALDAGLVSALKPRQPREQLARRAVAARRRVQHQASPQRVWGSYPPDDEPVPADRHERVLES